MLKDRGVMKWTSMMLPEHVSMLKDWKREQFFEKPKILDEQEIEHIHHVVVNAIESKDPVELKIYNPRNKAYEWVQGHLSYKQVDHGKLYLTAQNGESFLIDLSTIGQIRPM